jgi:hypothetical protein
MDGTCLSRPPRSVAFPIACVTTFSLTCLASPYILLFVIPYHVLLFLFCPVLSSHDLYFVPCPSVGSESSKKEDGRSSRHRGVFPHLSVTMEVSHALVLHFIHFLFPNRKHSPCLCACSYQFALRSFISTEGSSLIS